MKKDNLNQIISQELVKIILNSPRSIVKEPSLPKELELRLFKKVLERLKIIQ